MNCECLQLANRAEQGFMASSHTPQGLWSAAGEEIWAHPGISAGIPCSSVGCLPAVTCSDPAPGGLDGSECWNGWGGDRDSASLGWEVGGAQGGLGALSLPRGSFEALDGGGMGVAWGHYGLFVVILGP